MAFFAVHEIHGVPDERQGPREHAFAGFVVLAAHGLLALVLLLGMVREVVLTGPKEAPTVMVDVADHRTQVAVLAPPAPKQVRVAPVTVMAPEFNIQAEAKPPRADPAPTPPKPPAPVVETATASNPDAMMASPPSGSGAGAGAPSGTGSAAGAGGGAGGYDISAYLARVAAHIQAHLHRMVVYQVSDGPVMSDVKAVVHLIWRRDGTVEKVEIYRSSDFQISDKEAVAAVIRSQPLPPFPQELKGERINGIIPILFISVKKK